MGSLVETHIVRIFFLSSPSQKPDQTVHDSH